MEEMKPAAQDEQVFLRHGYAIWPARSLPVGLVEAVQAQHSAGLLMAPLVVEVAPRAWAAIQQLPEMHKTVPTRSHGKHGTKPTVKQTFTLKPTITIPHHIVCNKAVHQHLSREDVAEVNTALEAEATLFRDSPPHWGNLTDNVRVKLSESCISHIHTRIDQLVRAGVLRLDEPDGPNYAVAYGTQQMLEVMRTHVETRAKPWNTLDQVFSADLVFAFVRAIADVAGVCEQKRIVQVMLGFGNTEYYVVREKSSNNYEGYDEFRHLSKEDIPKLTRLLEFLGCATEHHKAVKERVAGWSVGKTAPRHEQVATREMKLQAKQIAL
jgi:hypothetical protein